MELSELYHKLSLSEVDFLPAGIIELLEKYNISTLGQLLGATRGLTKTSVFDNQENKEEIIALLLQYIPENIILEYRDFKEDHPTGLLIKPENEKDSELTE